MVTAVILLQTLLVSFHWLSSAVRLSLEPVCGFSVVPSEVADTCFGFGHCCCIKEVFSTCQTPFSCREGGGSCAETLWKPSLAELQAEVAHRHVLGAKAPNLEDHTDITSNTACVLESNCELVMCAGKRQGVFDDWGTQASLRLGLSSSIRASAASVTLTHWNPHKKISAYLSTHLKAGISTVSHPLKLSESSCYADQSSSTCCLGGVDRWRTFLVKLNSVKSDHFDMSKSRLKFTYVITAPKDSNDIELRLARMEGKWWRHVPLLNKIQDVKSKHSYLGQFKDWFLYAGEMWLQPKPGMLAKKTGVDLNDVVLVMDGNSGTIAPSSDSTTRSQIKHIMMLALGVGGDQIQVCLSPFHMKTGMTGWVQEEEACPNQLELYADSPS